MDKEQKGFYEVFTELQCFILANMTKGDVNGVTATHYNIMERIYRLECCTAKELARLFAISAPAISRHLKFLIENDLVEQKQSSIDRRLFNLQVTEKGKSIVDNSENFRETMAKKISKILNTEEYNTLTSLLNKVMIGIDTDSN